MQFWKTYLAKSLSDFCWLQHPDRRGSCRLGTLKEWPRIPYRVTNEKVRRDWAWRSWGRFCLYEIHSSNIEDTLWWWYSGEFLDIEQARWHSLCMSRDWWCWPYHSLYRMGEWGATFHPSRRSRLTDRSTPFPRIGWGWRDGVIGVWAPESLADAAKQCLLIYLGCNSLFNEILSSMSNVSHLGCYQ